jgi:lipoprotein signal peptidase
MSEIIIVPALFITIYMVIELFVHRQERLRILEKVTGTQSPDITSMLNNNSSFSFTGLRFGCLLVGLGIGLLCAFFIYYYLPESRNLHGYWFSSSTLSLACLLTFGGIGLLVSYFIERKDKKK